MTNERITNAVELLTLEVKEQVLFELKRDPEWMETTLQAENVKEWANNLIQTEVTGIVENTDRIEALEKKINDIDFNNEIHEMDNRVDEVESRIETIEQAKGDSVTETQVAEMIRQAFQAGIDAHYHLRN